jgi:hypothetical protein
MVALLRLPRKPVDATSRSVPEPRRSDALNITETSVVDRLTGLLRRCPCMPTFMYRCPTTGYRVQAFLAEDVSEDATFEPIKCVLCQRTHLVNPTTGEVAGEDSE